MPGLVSTNMTKIKSNLMAPDADTYVQAAMRTIGYANHTNGYLPHALMQLFINSIQYFAPAVANNLIINNMEQTRSRALRKAKSE